MKIRNTLTLVLAILLLSSLPILAGTLEFQGEFKSSLDVQMDNDSEIPAVDNKFILEISNYSPNSGLFKETLKYDSRTNNLDISELYSELYFTSTDLTIGKQRISWGKADGINPTDYFNPEDLTNPFSDDNKINIPAVRAKHYHQDWVFDLVWSPVFKGNRLPEPGDRWYPENSQGLPEGFSTELQAPHPQSSLENSQLGLRISRWSAFIDASVSYYYGWRKEPTVYDKTPMMSENKILLHGKYHRLQGIGADFAKTFGKYVFRGETVYFLTAAEDLKENYLQYVLGVDFNATDDLYINTQVFGEKEEEQGPQTGITLSTEYSINEFNHLKLNGLYLFENDEVVINPVYSNNLMDGVTLSIGTYLFNGNKAGDIGQFSDSDYTYIEVTRAF